MKTTTLKEIVLTIVSILMVAVLIRLSSNMIIPNSSTQIKTDKRTSGKWIA